MSDRIYASDYGDLIAQLRNQGVIHYEEAGSYQGTYIAVLADDKTLEIFTGSYGSCSGCDWLEAEEVYDSEKRKKYVPAKSAFDYVQEMGQPDIRMPISIARTTSLEDWERNLQAVKDGDGYGLGELDVQSTAKIIRDHFAVDGSTAETTEDAS